MSRSKASEKRGGYSGSKAKGPGCRSIRVGGSEIRLVYRYDREADLVEVLAIERLARRRRL